jgi:hypothetical protein
VDASLVRNDQEGTEDKAGALLVARSDAASDRGIDQPDAFVDSSV